MGGKKPFAGENDIIIDENELMKNEKVKSPIKSPLRKNINTVSFNPASKKGKLSFLSENRLKSNDKGLERKAIKLMALMEKKKIEM